MTKVIERTDRQGHSASYPNSSQAIARVGLSRGGRQRRAKGARQRSPCRWGKILAVRRSAAEAEVYAGFAQNAERRSDR